ncbi:MAG TPA: hypothetical protein VFW92_09065 [Candidatus Limnocylindrales bacterium]|nr:hypothetical protein [Candidatus Limnocylindrales bacterium]
MSLEVRAATPEELERWDELTVAVPGGDVYQSRAWGEYRGRHGWRPRYLMIDGGHPVLVLVRPWRWIGGAGAYISRGPVWSGGPLEAAADRLDAIAAWLGEHGVDVVSSDAEVPVETGYPDLLRARGFRQIEEIQPSRHRLRRALPPGLDEAALLAELPATVRYEIRGAERRGVRVLGYGRFDAPGGAGEGIEPPAGGPLAAAEIGAALQRLYAILAATAARRRFRLGPAEGFLDWGGHAVTAGLGFILEVRSPDDELLGAAMFYRHGDRFTYAHAGDVVERRRAYPGTTHLILWRALELALREGRAEVDLAGVDVAGRRRRPQAGEPMYGLLRFKELLGGEWLELSGNRERVMRPWRYAAGRITGRLAGLAADRRPAPAVPARAP